MHYIPSDSVVTVGTFVGVGRELSVVFGQPVNVITAIKIIVTKQDI